MSGVNFEMFTEKYLQGFFKSCASGTDCALDGHKASIYFLKGRLHEPLKCHFSAPIRARMK